MHANQLNICDLTLGRSRFRSPRDFLPFESLSILAQLQLRVGWTIAIGTTYGLNRDVKHRQTMVCPNAVILRTGWA